MQMFKKGFALLVALLLVMSLGVGCTSQEGQDSQDTNEQAEKTEGNKEESKQPVTLTLWHLWAEENREDGWSSTVERWAEDYESRNPHVTIEVSGNVNGDKLLTALTGGQGPDIFLNFWTNIPAWSEFGGLADLTEYIENDANFDKNDILEGAWGVGKYKERVYGIPFASFSSYIYYNKDILAEAGYDAPPETIEEFKELAIKLTKVDKDGNIERLGYMPDYPWLDNVLWPVMAGADWINRETNEITFNTPNMGAAYQWQADIYKEFVRNQLQKFKSGFGNDAQNPFLNGTLAMLFRGENFVNTIEEYGTEINYGVVPCPYLESNPEAKNAMMFTANVWNINNKSKNKDEAWRALSDLTSKEHMSKIATNLYDGGHLLSRISALKTLEADTEMHEKLREMAGFMATSNVRAFPMLPYINEYLAAINDEMTKALYGEQSVEDAQKKVVEKVQKLANEQPINE